MFDFFLHLKTQTIIISIILIIISIFIGYIIEKFRNKKLKTNMRKINIIISPVIMFLLLIVFEFDFIQCLKYYALFTILFHASYCDIKIREVDDYISVMLLLVGLLNTNETNLVYMFAGALFVFLPQIIMTFISKSVPIGGADIKISTACGFIFGPQIGLLSLLLGLLIALVANIIIAKVKKQKNVSFPFIPYFSIGLLGSLILFPVFLGI